MDQTPLAPQPQPAGVKSNVAAMLAYLFGILGGLIVYLVYKDKFARFHGLQSILFSLVVYALYYLTNVIPGVFFLRNLIGLASFVLTIILMVKAYQGEKYKLPVIGDVADTHS